MCGFGWMFKTRFRNAVTEHICRPVGPYDGAVVVFGGIHVDVIFVHKKGLWNDGKALVDLDGKLLIARLA